MDASMNSLDWANRGHEISVLAVIGGKYRPAPLMHMISVLFLILSREVANWGF